MEAERDILARSLDDAPVPEMDSAGATHRRFALLNGVDFDPPPRRPCREPPCFDE